MPTPKTDQKTLLTAAVAVPLIIIFTSQLLDMSLGMAVILGLLILLRILFTDDRRVTIAVMVALLLWAVYLPLAHEENSEFLGIAVLILAYSVMALGLNIIVGYAGLLDLGYVAFFALGALTAGWFMSGFYAEAGEGGNGIHFLVSIAGGGPAGHPPELHPRGGPGDHHLRDRRHADWPADAASARRLHRHRHAGVRRDHRAYRHQRGRAALQGRPAVRRTARGRVRRGSELLRGPTGHHADRQDRFRHSGSRSSRSTCVRGSGPL